MLVLGPAFAFLGIHSGVELLDHVNSTFNFFKTTSITFSMGASSFYILGAVHKGSSFTTTSQTLLVSFCHLNGCDVGVSLWL